MSNRIQINLVGNALDYLLLSGEMVNERSPRMLKHAVANLADGIELLLKARLETHDWCMLFKDVDKANKIRLANGDFISVTFDQAIERLQNICEVNFDKKSLATLHLLRNMRNRIRHFAVDIIVEQVMATIVNTYSFAIDFVDIQLRNAIDIEALSSLDELRALLGSFQHFVTQRLDEIAAELNDYEWLVKCPICLQVALHHNDDEMSCAFCRYAAAPEDAATAWKEMHYEIIRMKDWLDVPRIDCPECGGPAIPLDEGDGCQCFQCGHESYYIRCARCDAKTFQDVCEYCQHQVDKDD